MVTVDGRKVVVDTKTLRACIENGFLTSLRSKLDGEEYLSHSDVGRSALQLVTRSATGRCGRQSRRLIRSPALQPCRGAPVQRLGRTGVLHLEDLETGDLIVEPLCLLLPFGRPELPLAHARSTPGPPARSPSFQGIKLPGRSCYSIGGSGRSSGRPGWQSSVPKVASGSTARMTTTATRR